MRDWVPVRHEPLPNLGFKVVSPAGNSYCLDAIAPNHRAEILNLVPGTWTAYNDSDSVFYIGANADSENGSSHIPINFLRPFERYCFEWEIEGQAWTLTGELSPSAQILHRRSVDAVAGVQIVDNLKYTKMEYLFDLYMADAGTSCRRVPENLYKTPDFTVVLGGHAIPLEFKELSPNEDERADETLLHSRGYGKTHCSEIGRRISKVVNRARSQLRSFYEQNGDGPGILAVYDSTGQGHADPIELAGFFEGQITVAFSTEDRSIGDVFRKEDRRRSPRERNSIVSAIAVLRSFPKEASYFRSELEECVVNLFFYHNPYASQPLSTDVLASFGFPQYVVGPADPPIVRLI